MISKKKEISSPLKMSLKNRATIQYAEISSIRKKANERNHFFIIETTLFGFKKKRLAPSE